jgi:hypothetical protein
LEENFASSLLENEEEEEDSEFWNIFFVFVR